MSDIDNGVCTMCNLPITYDETPIEDGGTRDDESCLRTKPYCTNEDEHVDWRATCLHVQECARKATAEITRLRTLLAEACDILDSCTARHEPDGRSMTAARIRKEGGL